ncbi:hypothetical protein HDU99_007550, partial [Rhizoclosmatium hyalinum]
FVATRSTEKGQAAITQLKALAAAAGKQISVELVRLDLSDLKQTKEAALELAKKVDRIDILVNNAGIMDIISKDPFKLSKDGYESMFATNHLGHHMFTKHLLPVIIKTPGTPRIVILASYANWRAPIYGIDYQSLSQHNPAFTGGNYYGQSKLANILFATSLNKKYGYQIAVNSVHPGFVSTELMRPDPFTPLWFAMKIFPRGLLTRLMVGSSQGALSPEQGAFASLYAATHPEILEKGIKGKYIIPFGVVSDDHHPLAMDPEHAQKLWDFSEAVCSKY